MSTENDYQINSAQYYFLENDLKNVNRKVTPWIIFCAHRAMYINSNYSVGKPNDDFMPAELLQKSLEDLLFKYKVNLGVYGHDHVYQRQSAVYKKQVVQKSTPVYNPITREYTYVHNNPQATVHMVIGTAGAKIHMNAEPGPKRPIWKVIFL